MLSREQVIQGFRRRGQTVSQWARANGFTPDQVRAVIYGKAKGNWGISHVIAVKLGLKDGIIQENDRDAA